MFNIQSTAAKARVGSVLSNTRQMTTPHFILAGPRGAPAHLTPDMLQQVETLKSFNFCAADILPIINAIKSYGESQAPANTPQTSAYHRMSCLNPQSSIVLSLRNPLTDNSYLGLIAPSEKAANTNTNASAKGIFTLTDRGNIQLSPDTYMDAIKAIQPDMVFLSAEEITAAASSSRADKAIKRNMLFLGAALESRKKVFGEESFADNTSRPLFFAPLEGGLLPQKRALYNKVLDETIVKSANGNDSIVSNAFDGYVVGGIASINESTQRREMIAASLNNLPEDKPRAVNVLGQPREIIDMIASGIDLVTVTYPLLMTDAGLAIDAPFSMEELEKAAVSVVETPDTVEEKSESMNDDDDEYVYNNVAGAYINMRNDIYREDPLPMVENCTCYACRTHTRAYIHHLLNAHEMLAEVLLMLHNAHQYGRLFENARKAIAGGEDTLQKWITLAEKALKAHSIENMAKKKVKPKDMRDEE